MMEDWPGPAPRRRFQFRLAHLLAAVTALAIALGAILAPMYRARRGRAIVAALRSEGAVVQFDYQFNAEGHWIEDAASPPLTKLEIWLGRDESRHIARIGLYHSPDNVFPTRMHAPNSFLPDVNQVVPRVLAQLAAIDHPFGLDFRDSSLNGDGLADVARLRHVEFIDLGGTRLDDDGLRPLAAMLQLRELILPAATGDEGFAHLAGLTQLRRLGRCRPDTPNPMKGPNEHDLKRIREGQRLTDGGLTHLTGLTRLEKLDLNFARVTNDGLVEIARLKNLRSLDLSHTDITDAGLDYLKSAPRLEELWLVDTALDDDAVKTLKSFQKLKVVHVGGTLIDRLGFEGSRVQALDEVLDEDLPHEW